MACINPDGSLSPVAIDILTAMGRESVMPEQIAERVSHPLFKIRSTIRELKIAGLIEKPGDEELYRVTIDGRNKLNKQTENSGNHRR
jgi:hypothetical protein